MEFSAFQQILEDFFNDLPQTDQTEENFNQLSDLVSQNIMSAMTDYMSEEDIKELMILTQEDDIPMLNALETYCENHPYLWILMSEALEKTLETLKIVTHA